MNQEEFFQTVLSELAEVKAASPELEKMPQGCMLAGFDVEMVKPLITLTHLCKNAKTQWSCQGHLNSRWNLAYIRFAEGNQAPTALVNQLSALGFTCGYMTPFADNPEVQIYVIRAFESNLTDPHQQNLLNKRFLKELNAFSDKLLEAMGYELKKNVIIKN